ncbi:MAG: Lrp/AsnC family transcriptional regulator [Candidatus Bathyarchaeota archaeon]|nr:Lrp/AsnC family transcriptional regulator [Candidatus Termiticorpusculum sp.]
MTLKLDDKDLAILMLIQENSKLTANHIAKKTNTPITTVFAKIKRLEELGIIKQYRTILSPEKLNLTTTAFILAAVSYENNPNETLITQRGVAQEIAKLPDVQEVHIITGDWDLLIKIRAENVNAIGKFVVDKLRRINGLQKTLTCMIFETIKETTSLPVKTSLKETSNKP